MNARQLTLLVTLALLLSGVVQATSVVNVLSPTPDGTVTASRNVAFRFTIDTDETGCWLNLGLTNGTILGNMSGLAANLSTTKASDGRTYNRTHAVPIDSLVGASHNFSVYCGAIPSTSTLIGTFSYKLRTTTPTGRSPANNSITNISAIRLNATTSVAINIPGGDLCWYQIGNANGTIFPWQLLNASDTTNKTFVNGSVIILANSTNVAQHNITFRCNDSSGNATSETYTFKVDTVAPTLSVNNATGTASVLSLNTSIADNNTGTCTITLNGASLTAILVGTGTTSYCTSTTSGAEWTSDGNVTLRVTATDAAGNLGSAATRSMTRKTLSSGWNNIAVPAAMNLSTLCARISGCTSASYYNNSAASKAFTTYSTSAPTVNDGFNLVPGDAALVYTTSTPYFLSDDFLPSIGSGASTENVSLTSGWNHVALTRTANLTSVLNVDVDNITGAAYLDNGTYKSCTNNSLCTTGGLPGAVSIPKGSSVWILTNGAVQMNRSTVSA